MYVNEKFSLESVKNGFIEEYQKLLMMAHLLCATSNISLTLEYPKTCPGIPKIDMGGKHFSSPRSALFKVIRYEDDPKSTSHSISLSPMKFPSNDYGQPSN